MNTAEMKQMALWRMQVDDYVVGAGWTPSSDVLHVLSSSGALYFLEAKTGRSLLQELAHPEGALCMSSSSAAAIVATGGMDGKVQIRDGLTGKVLNEHILGTAWVEQVQWSPDGVFLAATAGKSLYLFNLAGEEIARYTDHESTVSVVSWRSDSQAIATGCYSAVRLFDMAAPARPYESLVWKNSMISLAWSPGGDYVAAGTQDAKIHFWELPYVPESDLEMSGYASKVKELSWDGNGILLASNCNREIIVWDVSGDGPAGTKPLALRGHNGKISKVVYQNNGEVLASGDDLGELVLWAPQQSVDPLVKEHFMQTITTLVWSPGNVRLVAGTAGGEIAVL